MKGYARDHIFWICITIISLVHVDFWAWNKIHPMAFGWIPYHLWFDGMLTIAGALFFLWWGKKGWPDPPDGLEK